MISREDYYRVLVQTALLENIQKLADAIIHVAASTIVGAACTLDLVVRKVLVPEITNLHKSLAVGVLLVFGNGNLGHVDVDALVAVPVLLLDGIGVVGMGERDLEWEN